MKLTLILAALALALLIGGCALQRAIPTQTTTLQHGPFEIVATGRRISSGAFPNNSANPFVTMEVTGFTVRWRGQTVEVPQVGTRFWRALRLPDAPEPALLVSTTDLHLITEHEGRLVVNSFGEHSTDLAQLQWLDSQDGQPGAVRMFGIEYVDPATGTELRGGRWLRVSHHTVLDVQTLQTFSVRPWVPAGQPLAGMNGGTIAARMLSPGRTQYVVPSSQYDHSNGSVRVDALVMVDIPSGEAYALKIDKRHMRFTDLDDIHLAWIDHYFEWSRDSTGRERLKARKGAKPMPWRGRYVDFTSFVEYRVQPVRPEMDAEFKRFIVERLGAHAVSDAPSPSTGRDTFQFPGCDGVLAISTHDDHVGIYEPMAKAPPWYRCQDQLRRVGAAFDAELATGRLDRLFITSD